VQGRFAGRQPKQAKVRQRGSVWALRAYRPKTLLVQGLGRRRPPADHALAPESYGDVMIRIAISPVAYSCSFAQAALSIVLVEAALKCRYLKARH
jgi:hypothetical protein